MPFAYFSGTKLSGNPISCKPQIIPFDSFPRNLLFLILTLLAIRAPGKATTTFSPAATFGAPQTI